MKKGIRLILFLLVLGAMIYGAYGIYSWKDTSGDYLSSTQQLYHTPEGTIDVAFAGSSHCYCTIYPALLWERSGISAFDMAVSGQDKASTYHMLVELCKTQHPKTVWVDLYGLLLDRQGIEGNTYRNMLAMRTSKNSVELIKEYVEPERQMDFFLKWPIVHTRFWEIGKYDYVQYEPSIYGRGGVYQWGQKPIEKGDFETETVGALDEKNYNWLSRLQELSQEEGFDLVFFVAPFDILEEEQEVINAAGQFAKERDIPFFDLNKMAQELSLDYAVDFRESYHLNAYGAEKVTEFVRQYLEEHYDLADHRGDPKYESWDKDVTWYRHLELQEKLVGGLGLKDAFDQISKMDQLCVVVDVRTDDREINEDEITFLENLGFTREELLEGGSWILEGGVKKKVLDDQGEVKEYTTDLNSYDSMRIRRGDTRTASDVAINYEELLRMDCTVSVVVYDLFLQEKMHSFGF